MANSRLAQKSNQKSLRKKLIIVSVFIILCLILVSATVFTKIKDRHEADLANNVFLNFTDHAPKLQGSPLFAKNFSDTNGDRGPGSIINIEPVDFYYRDTKTQYVVGSSISTNYAQALYRQFASNPDWNIDNSSVSVDKIHKHFNFSVIPNDKQCQKYQCSIVVSLDEYDSAADMTDRILNFEDAYQPLTRHFVTSKLPVYGYMLSLEYIPRKQ